MALVGLMLINGIQIEEGNAQVMQIGQFFSNSVQVPAEKIIRCINLLSGRGIDTDFLGPAVVDAPGLSLA